MSLLRGIREGSIDHNAPLSNLLRKCLILAEHLQHEPLREWASRELNGYSNGDPLPPYRSQSAEVRGNFRNAAWQVTNRLIPRSAVEPEHQEALFTATYLSGVAHYEALLKTGEHRFASYWPADVVAYYQSRLGNGYYLTEARLDISLANLDAMLDQIRNRILLFALEIEKENPEAGEAEPGGDPPVAPEKVQQSFVTHIHGGTNIVASGSQNVISDFEQVAAGDWASLVEELKELGLADDDLEALQTAIDKDSDAERPGPAVKNWLGDVTARIASGSLTLTTSAAGSGIATMVMKYLGVV